MRAVTLRGRNGQDAKQRQLVRPDSRREGPQGQELAWLSTQGQPAHLLDRPTRGSHRSGSPWSNPCDSTTPTGQDQ